MSFSFKSRYGIEDLLEIMALLRSPGGCPWDIEQDHLSIRENLIEETYEVLDAIDSGDTENLREELGDLLLQVVFHSRMEQEAGSFDFNDVCHDICHKLIIRHPHVFADVQADTPEEVLRNWNEIKQQTKGQKTATESMVSVPKGFPALMRAEKIQKKASRVGFDWTETEGAMEKLTEEIGELREAIAAGEQSAIEDEFGDLLFAAVNVSRFVHVKPETALAHACDKFVARFSLVEQMAAQRGIDMQSATLEQLDTLWDEAKLILVNAE
ncbi:MAG: nucleoside triphosphate pyrophosphohydrolase [Ruminococcaceae bacterium]|nr:nucleoside triphosphate pyrophosphohydrolase [Oscillospiraceae bacterium]